MTYSLSFSFFRHVATQPVSVIGAIFAFPTVPQYTRDLVEAYDAVCDQNEELKGKSKSPFEANGFQNQSDFDNKYKALKDYYVSQLLDQGPGLTPSEKGLVTRWLTYHLDHKKSSQNDSRITAPKDGLVTTDKSNSGVAEDPRAAFRVSTYKNVPLTPFNKLMTSDEREVLARLVHSERNGTETIHDIFRYSNLKDEYLVDVETLFPANRPKTCELDTCHRSIVDDIRTIKNSYLDVYEHALHLVIHQLGGRDSHTQRLDEEKQRIWVLRHETSDLGDVETQKAIKKELKQVFGEKKDIAGLQSRLSQFLRDINSSLSKAESKDSAKRIWEKASRDVINRGRGWKTISLEIPSYNYEVLSELIPLNQSTTTQQGPHNVVLAERQYTGVGCQSNFKTYDQAGNVYITRLQNGDQLLFSAIRHGIVATPKRSLMEEYVVFAQPENLDSQRFLIEKRVINKMSIGTIQGYINLPDVTLSDENKATIRNLCDKGDLGKARNKLAKYTSNYYKAKDLLRAVLMKKVLEDYTDQDGNLLQDVAGANLITIKMLSLSLVTPDSFRNKAGFGYHEKDMLYEQYQALKLLPQMSALDKAMLLAEFRNSEGQPLFPSEMRLNIQVDAFNFGVNEREYAGRNVSHPYVQGSYNQFIERVRADNTDPTFRFSSRRFSNVGQDNVIVSPTFSFDPPYFFGDTQQSAETGDSGHAERHLADVTQIANASIFDTLRTQVEDTFRAYTQLGLMEKQPIPYMLPVMIAALGYYHNYDILFNCKSGKDRTGLFDVMVKIFMRELQTAKQQYINTQRSGVDVVIGDQSGLVLDKNQIIPNAVTYFSRMQSAYLLAQGATSPVPAGFKDSDQGREAAIAWLRDQQYQNKDMLMLSGNLEIQEQNTLCWGYKLKGENTARMFDIMFGIENMGEVHGFSCFVQE